MNHELHDFYVTLLSTASQSLFPTNTHSAFTVELAQTIHLGTKDSWEVGVCEYACPPRKVGVYKPVDVISSSRASIYCNLVPRQFVGNELVRCLRTFTFPSQKCHLTYDNIYYVPVEKKSIRHIRIEVLTLSGKPVVFSDSRDPSICVLHFRRIPGW
jgi:hypothetical protein